MYCPFCNFSETRVLDSRLVAEGNQVRRRRVCEKCNERFTTYETAELVMPKVIKRNSVREAFNEQKLLAGLNKALEKRPINSEEIRQLVNRIKSKVRANFDSEVTTQNIGEIVMQELKKIDHIAYVRFASVYRNFQDIEAFRKALNALDESDEN